LKEEFMAQIRSTPICAAIIALALAASAPPIFAEDAPSPDGGPAAIGVPRLLGFNSPCTGIPPNPPDDFLDTLVIGGLDLPTGIAFLPDGRLLVVEQKTARLRVVRNGAFTTPDPALVVPNVNATAAEGGLLGVAVDPGWPARPYVYVHYTYFFGGVRNIKVARFTAVGDLDGTGDGGLTFPLGDRYEVLGDVPDARGGHNGGTLRFGPDGMMFVSVGDDFQYCPAQDTVSMRGVVMRLDVSALPAGGGGPPAKSLITPPDNPFVSHPVENARLVWSLGLRNPFRIHVDPVSGNLVIGDVGDAKREELDFADAGGRNYGWPLYEGDTLLTTCAMGDTAFTPWIYVYPHLLGQAASVIAGPFYRTPPAAPAAWPAGYNGDILFSDYYLGLLWRMHWSGSQWEVAAPVPGQPDPGTWGNGYCEVSDWAIASDGDLWYCRQAVDYAAVTGEIRRIHSTLPVAAAPGGLRAGLRFDPPWPSPARGGTNLRWTQPAPAPVKLTIVDASGRHIATLVRGLEDAGTHVVPWRARDAAGRRVPAGVYLARLEVGGAVDQRRIIVVP
jgi:glucose/arabinose dehydrogenase